MKVQTLWTFHAGEWRKFYYHYVGEPSKRKQPSPEMRESLFLEQEGQCAFCKTGLRTDPADFDCDHIIPVRCGGPTCMTNLHLLCIRCHRAKSARERSRPEEEDQVIETPNITPKSIPEIVGQSVDGMVNITGEGATGTGYSIEYGTRAGKTSRRRMWAEAEKKKYEKKIAAGVTEKDKKRYEREIRGLDMFIKALYASPAEKAAAKAEKKQLAMWHDLAFRDYPPSVVSADPVVSEDPKRKSSYHGTSLLSILSAAKNKSRRK